MRATAVVLVLLLLAAIPVSGSQARDDGVDNALVLPPVQWNASVGIGYISTAPLVSGGLVIVKGGGDPMTGAGAGMVAYRADTGEQVWRANHTESTTGFEIAPLEVSWPCRWCVAAKYLRRLPPSTMHCRSRDPKPCRSPTI